MSLASRTAVPIFATMLVLTGCERSRSEPAGKTQITSSAISITTADDPRVVQRVEEAIGADAPLAIAARNVTVGSESGVVTLTGTVPDELTRKRVLEVAGNTPGVARIVDRTVVSQSRDIHDEESDPKIEREITRALEADDALAKDAHAITASSKHGIVTLQGRVDSAEQRDAIERKADRVPGVAATVDQIEVAPAGDR
jgi:osmotically-inducible protein OsmY